MMGEVEESVIMAMQPRAMAITVGHHRAEDDFEPATT
jgi:hypothetical protein